MTNTLTCLLNCGFPVTYDPTKIIVHGVKEHNLKNICFAIPKGQLVCPNWTFCVGCVPAE